MSEGALRAEPRTAGLPVLERVAAAILERGLAHLDGGTLVVQLPDGSVRRFGTGAAVEMDDLRRPALPTDRDPRGDRLGESYMAEEWDTGDLVGLFELLLANTRAAEAPDTPDRCDA